MRFKYWSIYTSHHQSSYDLDECVDEGLVSMEGKGRRLLPLVKKVYTIVAIKLLTRSEAKAGRVVIDNRMMILHLVLNFNYSFS